MTGMIRDAVVALSGGIGGAKLALGLQRVVPPGKLTVIANTGDDFEHLGLHVSPDIDTLLYTLSGLNNQERGWGRAGETWNFMAAIETLGGETWFKLGDADLAMHIERTRRLRRGERLSTITADFGRQFGINANILPMSDEPVRTRVETIEGWLDFQRYFVERRCEPIVRGFAFDGARAAHPAPAVLAALSDPGLRVVVICPSNPFISIDPILAVPGIRQAIKECAAPVIAISPIIGGQAIKGPTAKMMAELGLAVSAGSVARHYDDLLDAYLLDPQDGAEAANLSVQTMLFPSLMRSLEDRENLARATLQLADGMPRPRPSR